MKRVYGISIASFTAVCVCVTSAWAVIEKIQPFTQSDPAPYAGKAIVAQLQSNVQTLTQQIQKLADTVNDQRVKSLMDQRRAAQAAINDAAANNRRDPIAEKVRDDANVELMKLFPAPIPAPPP